MKTLALSQQQLRLVIGGQNSGSGGGDGVEPPQARKKLKPKFFVSNGSNGSGGGDGVEPPL
jgi:hypothetical protein